MKNCICYLLISLALLTIPADLLNAQEKPVSEMNREEVLSLTYDELVEMELDELMTLAGIVGMSIEELMLNASVSTASKIEEDLFDSPLSTTVLQQDEIEQSGATCIPELLRLMPGIIVREKTPGNYDVHIRGNDNVPPGQMLVYSENTISLVMVDNRPMFNFFQGGTFWETFPIGVNDIARIEVIRGPASALYGPNAVSGVIHIITKNPETSRFKIEANAQVGNNNSQIAHVSSSFGIGKRFKARISANYQHRNRFQESYYLWELDDYRHIDDILFHLDSMQLQNPNMDIQAMYPEPELARQTQSYNIFLDYRVNDKIDFAFDIGGQASEVQTSYIDMGSFLSFREANTGYFSARANVFGFDAQFSGVTGQLDASKGNPGFKYDMGELNGRLGYTWKIGDFTFQPGLNFNAAYYNDSMYVDVTQNEGFLNGEKVLATTELNLRADYLAFDKLRLIAAYSAGGYYKPEKPYQAYQFVTSYKINEQNLVRAVYSKASSGPFMASTYADYRFHVPDIFRQGSSGGSELPVNLNFKYLGNENLDLAEMQLVEVGFRNRLTDRVQADFEVFYTITENFATPQLITDSIVLTDQSIELYQEEQFMTNDVKSHQFGISANFTAVLSKKIQLKAFGTLQKTFLADYGVSDSAYFHHLTGISTDAFELFHSPAKLMIEHTYTPTFYGGFSVNYSPNKQWNFNTNMYYYTKQSFYYTERSFRKTTVPAKAITNLKISYRFYKNNYLYINARNLFNSSDNEFVFTDDIKGLYTFGVNLSF